MIDGSPVIDIEIEFAQVLSAADHCIPVNVDNLVRGKTEPIAHPGPDVRAGRSNYITGMRAGYLLTFFSGYSDDCGNDNSHRDPHNGFIDSHFCIRV
ncbi:MAG: hypothetical protein KJO19_01515 [Woeseia sp.]|nr:hypothetical protein [Woeseia sp.]